MTDKKILKLACQIRNIYVGNNSSRGYCILVSQKLHRELIAVGCPCTVMQGSVGRHGHLWVQLEDGRILNATGDQFTRHRLPPVYLGPRPHCYKINKERYYDNGKRVRYTS